MSRGASGVPEPPRHSLNAIAAALGAQCLGAVDRMVRGAAAPAQAGPDDLIVALTQALIAQVPASAGRVALLPDGTDWRALGMDGAISVPNARLGLAGVTRAMDAGPGYPAGVHPTAFIDPTAQVPPDVSVGPHAVISAGAAIGAGSVIGAGAFVGAQAVIGPGAMIHPQVRIGERVRIGASFIAHPGATLGFDGFSFVTAAPSNAERARAALAQIDAAAVQTWHRVHSLGSVVIGDDVEIGANTTIDSGTLGPTRIGPGTKIDNLCAIGHNVQVGAHCLFAAMTGIAGSARIGNHVVLGGKVGVSDHVTVEDNVVAGGGAIILGRVPAGRFVLGHPAQKAETFVAAYRALRRLPRFVTRVSLLQKAVFKSGKKD